MFAGASLGLLLLWCGGGMSWRPLRHVPIKMMVAGAGDGGVVVIGGGFGGLYTALKLERRLRDRASPCTVTLIDPKDRFVFLPLLYELAVGSASALEVAPRYRDLLRETKIRFVQGTVQNVDLASRSVSVLPCTNASGGSISAEKAEEMTIAFDKVVLACGAQPNLSVIPGAPQHALPFCTIDHANRLSARLRALVESNRAEIRVAVLGGGYSGVEVSSTVAEYLGARGRVTILDRNECVMVSSPAHNRREAERVLGAKGVDVLCRASVQEVTAEGVVYSIPSPAATAATAAAATATAAATSVLLPSDLVIATLGVAQSPVVQALPLEKDRFGRVLTSRSLRAKSDPNLFALGDCSCVEGESVPSTAQAAMQQSDIVVANVMLSLAEPAAVAEASLRKFSFVPLGEMLTLGTKDAAVTSLAGLVELDGLVASVGRRLVYALRMPTPQQSLTALVSSSVVMAANELNRLLGPNGKP